MKNNILVFILLLMIMAESSGQKQASNYDLIKVDVRKNYSTKKELILQDFMDVEYIALETKKGFYNQGVVQAVGKEIIIVKNGVNDGDIYVYNRTGKALRVINHKGSGPEEYTAIYDIALDEDNRELFIHDMRSRKIVVYDLDGQFRRYLRYKESKTAVFNYDKDHLICYNYLDKDIPYVLLSKQDGSIIKEIKIPFKEKKAIRQISSDRIVSSGHYREIIPFKGNWMLLEVSSDTVYTFLSDYSLRPFLVRTPSIQSMKPEVMLIFRFLSDRYIFMETIRNEFDFKTGKGFAKTFFMYDRQEKNFFAYNVYNSDYSRKKEIYFSFLRHINNENHEIEAWQALEADQLYEDYREGILKGRLKEIAAKLEEEDNPVIMLVKHKKNN